MLPEVQRLPLPTLQTVLGLARQGATVIFSGKAPADVPGLHQLESRRQSFRQLLQPIHFHEHKALSGKGTVLTGPLETALATAGVQAETITEQGWLLTRRTLTDGEVYFLSNQSQRDFDGWLPLRANAQSVWLLDPMTGRTGRAAHRLTAGGGTEVYVQATAGAAVLLRTYAGRPPAGNAWAYTRTDTGPLGLKGHWKVTFVQGGPTLPPPQTQQQPDSWTNWGPAYAAFSGTARYELAFPQPTPSAGGYWLSLGRVHETARVRLNGVALDTLIGPDYRLYIPENHFEAHNTLVVEVSNLMANRIADLDRRGVTWQRFYNINMSARSRDNLKNGVFNAADWKPRPSGLLGPVTLTPVTIFQP